jgi:putative flippase GtrA
MDPTKVASRMKPAWATRHGIGAQFFRFLSVGVLNTAVQYVVFALLYRVAHVNYLIASAAGYCLGMINSYFLNRRWTFASGNAAVAREAARFVTVNLLALGTNTALLFLLVSTQNVRPLFAQIWAIAGSLIVNFLLNRLWTFADHSDREAQ